MVLAYINLVEVEVSRESVANDQMTAPITSAVLDNFCQLKLNNLIHINEKYTHLVCI